MNISTLPRQLEALGFQRGQSANGQTSMRLAVTGTTTIVATSVADPIAAYTYDQVFRFGATGNNTGPATLSIDGLAALPLRDSAGVELAANGLRLGRVYEVIGRGTPGVTFWQIVASPVTEPEIDAKVTAEVDASYGSNDSLTGSRMDATSRILTTSILGGDVLDLAPLSSAALVTTPEGLAARITGAGTVAMRTKIPVDPTRKYRVIFRLRRAVNTTNVSTDAIKLALAQYSDIKAAISPAWVNAISDITDLTVGAGWVTYAVTVSRTAGAGVDVVLSESTRYVTPFYRVSGAGAQTDILPVFWQDVTDAGLISPDVSGLSAQVAALESVEAGDRLDIIEAELSSPLVLRFPTVAAATSGTIPESVDLVELAGFDSPNGQWLQFARVALAPTHEAKFPNAGDNWEIVRQSQREIPANMFAPLGGANDGPAIQRAIEYARLTGGGCITFPAGTYFVEGVTFYPNIYFRGAGVGATTLRAPTAYSTDFMFRANADGASIFFHGGIRDMHLEGPGTGTETVPGNGNANTFMLIDFEPLDALGVGYRLYHWLLLDSRLSQAGIGFNGYKNHYSVVISNCYIHNCTTGIYIDLQHPNIINVDIRYCGTGLFGRAMIDWTCTQVRFSLCDIGLDGSIRRSQLIGCVFWQNATLGARLGAENRLIGCLLKGPGDGDFPTGTPGNRLLMITERKVSLMGNVLLGGNDGPMIDFAQTNAAAQAQNTINGNYFLVDRGPVLEKTGNGSTASLDFSRNMVNIVGPDVKTDKPIIINIPLGTTGLCEGAMYTHNDIRVDGAGGTPDLTEPLIRHGDISGWRYQDNDVRLTGGIVVDSAFSCASQIRGIATGNKFSASATGINVLTVPMRFNGASYTDFICHSNIGFKTSGKGTAAVPSGATTISVTHGLAVTPSAQDVRLTPTNNLGSATKYWISAVGATTFTINVDINPGVATAAFAWQLNPYSG